jgi:hypothetical protein
MKPRMMMVLAIPLLLAACDSPADPQLSDACGASDLQDLVGRPYVAIADRDFGRVTRVVRPGDAVTMDYSAERLNIRLDDKDVIAGVTCG